jgi:hypothetical protein
MSEVNQTMAPPLDLDLGTVKTDLPLLSQGIYDLIINKVEQKQSHAGQPMLSLELRTTGPAQAQDGSQLGIGIPMFENLNMAPSGKATWDMVVRNVAAVTQCVGLTTNWGEFSANAVALLQGQTGRVKVGIAPAGVDKNGKAYKAKNVVEVWMKRA